jgi:hypothetical protein
MRVELKLIDPELLERAARAAYYECIQAYAEMTPLPPGAEELAQELSERVDVWELLQPEFREHWKRIVARAFAEAIPIN